jgi:hypothetical protein
MFQTNVLFVDEKIVQERILAGCVRRGDMG